MDTHVDTIVIGGGIAGLTAAWAAAQANQQVVCLEQQGRPGGVIYSAQEQGLLKEWGPHAFLGDSAALLQLAQEVGVSDEVLESPPAAAQRFIFHGDRIHLVPRGPLSLLTTPLLSWRGKWRLLTEPWIREPRTGGEETIERFVTRRLGREVLANFIDPLIGGIFAGDPAQLSIDAAFPTIAGWAHRHGSLVRGAIHQLRARRANGHRPTRAVRSFRHGMATLPQAIATRLGERLQLETTVTNITPLAEGGYRVTARGRGEEQRWTARRLVIATPAGTAANLLQSLAPAATDALRRIPYAPVAVVHVAYPATTLPRAFSGYGFLVPRTPAVRALGCLWSSQCFAERAGPDTFLCTMFFGGARDPGLVEATDEMLFQIVAADVRTTMGIVAPPSHFSVIRHRAAIPQYTLGHRERLAAIAVALQPHPDLALTGNYFTGTSVNDTITHARSTLASLG